ncbi:MAG: hypothetical protein P8R46_14310 [Planctomycetota bacterium]|nr:hypothetical protein [Planctomycetota bacterium]
MPARRGTRSRRTPQPRPSARIAEPTDSPAAWCEADWSRFLTDRFELPIEVSFGRSRSAPVQARAFEAADGQTGWQLRLHRMFASAPEEVRDALAKWLRAGRRARKAGPILDDWIHDQVASLPRRTAKVSIEPAGNVHDLETLALPLIVGEFANDFRPRGPHERPRITWGRRARSKSRRSLRLGSFEPESRVVRIHPVLDQRAVPAWFVTFVLKHELLHSVLPSYRDAKGKWVHHGPEFRGRESAWLEYESALRWERQNLPRLIRSARLGSELRARPEDLIVPDVLAVERQSLRQHELPF